VPDARQVPEETVTSQLPGTHIEPKLKVYAAKSGKRIADVLREFIARLSD
jgi:hypothetical protein